MDLASELAADARNTSSDSNIGEQILEIAQEYLRLQSLVSELQDETKTANKLLKEIAETKLPELLEDLGTEIWQDSQNGISIKIADRYYGSFPKGMAPIKRAADEIKRCQGEDILQIELSVKYPKGQLDLALEHAELLDELLPDDNTIAPEVRYSVHPQTLKKFCKDKLAEGSDLDISKVGIHHVKGAEVKG